MKKFLCALLAVLMLAGCSDTKTPETTAVTTTAPEIKVEGLEIISEDGINRVIIPADYTDTNIGEYFRRILNVVYEPDENSMFCVYRGALYSKDMTTLYAVPYECEDEPSEMSVDPDGNPARVFTVPETVTYIMPNAFFVGTETNPVKNIYIHDGITSENVAELVLWCGVYITRI